MLVVYGLMQLVTRFLEVFAPNEVETRFLHPRNMNLIFGDSGGNVAASFSHTRSLLVQFMVFDSDSIYGADWP